MFVRTLLTLLVLCISLTAQSADYQAVQRRLARGWNTWDVNSVMAQVLLPAGFSIRVGLKHKTSLNSDAFLSDALIGRQGPDVERVFPEQHTWTGSYTSVRVSWRGHQFRLESAQAGEDLVMIATPLSSGGETPALVISAAILWDRAGAVERVGDSIQFSSGSQTVRVFCTECKVASVSVPVAGPYWALSFDGPVGISTGHARSLAEIGAVLRAQRPKENGIRQAIESVIGWDTIYEPSGARVITPVSRVWCVNWGGYVLFDWDTFFAASLAATGSRDLAYANALEMLREHTPAGFIPNYARADSWKSFDRSEPPVGAITVLNLYRKFHDRWLLNDAFDALLAWNRWWAEHRDIDGYLVWGTDADNPPRNLDDRSVGTLQAARYESGLDNSPMYDDVGFSNGRMQLADVGLMSMYIADCDALASISRILGRPEAAELLERSHRYRDKLQTLWDPQTGMFLNRDLRTGVLSPRLSPTNFYPLLAKAATPTQARQMVERHLLNPCEFWGEWVIPSISRSDPAFADQDYWRGRIWGPMNYLVYLGLRHYDFPQVRRELAQKSLALFDKEWTAEGHVHENYNAVTGAGDDVRNSDRFYHWGALLGLISLQESEAPDD